MKKKFFPVFGLLFISISCASNGKLSPTTNFEGVPDWFLKQVHYDKLSLTLYGYGAGNNLDIAKNNAAADIAKFLVLEISSTSTSEEVINRESSSTNTNGFSATRSEFAQQVKTRTQPINLNGVDVVESIQIEKLFYTKVKTNALQLNNYLEEKVINSTKNFHQRLAKFDSKNTIKLSELVELSKYLDATNKANAYMDFLRSLNNLDSTSFISNEDLLEVTKMYTQNIDKFNSLAQKITLALFFESGDETNKSLVTTIAKILAKNNIKSQRIDDPLLINNLPNVAGLLIVNSQVSKNDFQAAKVMKISVNLNLLDNASRSLASKSYNLSALSAISHNDAANKAISNWEKSFEKNLLVDMLIEDQT